MTLEELRQEWEAVRVRHPKVSKEFRILEKEFYLKFLDLLKDSSETSNGEGLYLPEFTARDGLGLLKLSGAVKEAYSKGWRGKSFYFQDK